MKILLINPAHPAIGSRIPREKLPPLGLLAVGGSLVDAGHEVKVVDGEFGPMGAEKLAAEAAAWGPEAVMVGHAGSTSGHPSARAERSVEFGPESQAPLTRVEASIRHVTMCASPLTGSRRTAGVRRCARPTR